MKMRLVCALFALVLFLENYFEKMLKFSNTSLHEIYGYGVPMLFIGLCFLISFTATAMTCIVALFLGDEMPKTFFGVNKIALICLALFTVTVAIRWVMVGYFPDYPTMLFLCIMVVPLLAFQLCTAYVEKRINLQN